MKIIYGDKEYTYADGTTFGEIAASFQEAYEYPIGIAVENNKLRELFKVPRDGAEVEFATIADRSGHKAYTRTAFMIMLKAAYDVLGSAVHKIKIEFAIGRGYYCSYKGERALSEADVNKIKNRMQEIISEDITIEKHTYGIDEAMSKFSEYGMEDRKKLFTYRRSSTVNLYKINKFEDYFYGFMLPSTGYLKVFDLIAYDEGMMLVLPSEKAPLKPVDGYKDYPKLYNAMKESTKWGEMLGIGTVGELNDCISRGEFPDLVLLHEALQEKRIADIAADIIAKGGRKFIMIAGPSSSGKTSFSHRLSIELRAQGMKPHPIALDNYYVDRDQTPLDEDGKPNFECLEALNVELFNENMTDLLNGKTVELPRYNFITGKSGFRGDFLTLGEDDVLVIEGIHGLNDKLSYSLPASSKYKIYISALTTLNIDEHNRIPTTDARLLRRMVRDFRTRGASAKQTLDMWDSVRRGEDENIFPFQEEADAMFNSALCYELAVLKQYAEPLLFSIKQDEPEYVEARRLLKFLEYFLGVSTEGLPNNSIVREFVGGSVFPV